MGRFAELLIDIDTDTDVSGLSYDNLRIIYGTYTTVNKPDEESENTEAPKPKYQLGFLTPLGNISRDTWYKLAELLICKSYEGWITDALQEWYMEHHPGDGSEEKARELALKAHIHKDYDKENWIYYIPWNRQYRSTAVAGKAFPTVSFLCCGHTEMVSPELIATENKQQYSRCPYCYQRSEVLINKAA